MERLQRVLAARGFASRRKAEEMILAGRVRVDGKVVRELGTKVDASRQKIEVDGNLIPESRHRYIMLNKPSGYITTMSDERGRWTVMELVDISERVVPVGRLDRKTEGLLLLTNDGEVAHRVMHPRFEIDKEYEVLLDGHPPAGALERVRRGISVDDQLVRPSEVRPLRNLEEGTLLRVVLHEGRNRVVRRIFEELGYPVLRLIRTRIGPLHLGAIPRGQWRELTDGELTQLREAIGLLDEDVVAESSSRRPMRPSHAEASRIPDRGDARGAQDWPSSTRPRRDGSGGVRRPTAQPGQDRRGSAPQRPDRPRRETPADRAATPLGPRRAQESAGERRVDAREQPRRGNQPDRQARTSRGPRAPVRRGGPATPQEPERGQPQRSRPTPESEPNRARPRARPVVESTEERSSRRSPAPRRPDWRAKPIRGRSNSRRDSQGKGSSGPEPLHDRDRRAGGGGQEHRRRTPRPPA